MNRVFGTSFTDTAGDRYNLCGASVTPSLTKVIQGSHGVVYDNHGSVISKPLRTMVD
jgi:hypothetical protein